MLLKQTNNTNAKTTTESKGLPVWPFTETLCFLTSEDKGVPAEGARSLPTCAVEGRAPPSPGSKEGLVMEKDTWDACEAISDTVRCSQARSRAFCVPANRVLIYGLQRT